MEASKGRTIAYFTAFEFGDEGAVVWTNQKEVDHSASVAGALEILGTSRVSAGIDRYRKSHFWAAAAVLQEFERRDGEERSS